MIKKSKLFLVAGALLFGHHPTQASVDAFLSHKMDMQVSVRGKVVDERDSPVQGATVLVVGSSTSVVTDSDGAFSLSAKLGDQVRITYLGYQDVMRRVDGTEMTITMSDNNQSLDEVIVVGYGTTTRRAVVGAVDQINAKAIENRPVANAMQALQGASPSLNIQQRSMDPNSNTMNINIRGISTLNSNAPLVVIDGLITDVGALNKLNPMDIENVSVLKDAGTAAIYGSRSANGVVLVTTKSGKRNQRPRVNLSSLVGAQDPQILFSPVQGYQNATLKNLALTNVGKDPEFTPDQINDLYNNRDIEQWNYDQIMKTALQQNHNVTVSGGGESSTYLFSGGFLDQRSNFVGNKDYGIKRYNLRSNMSTEYGIFKLNTIVSYARNNGLSSTASNAIINSSRIPPYYYYRMQADNGRYLINNALTDQNPLAELRDGGYTKSDNDFFNANVALDVRLMDGLKLRGVFGADINADHRFIRRIQVPLYATADAERPAVNVNSTRNTEDFNEKRTLLNYQLLLDYHKTFGNHELKGLFGATNESETSRINEIKYRFTDPILGTPTTGTEFDPSSRSSLEGTREINITSLIGRLNYAYAQRYFLEATFRYDGSSRFARAYRWGFFPSVSAGWRLSEESFMQVYNERVGDLKLRASYGVLGNQDMDPYQFLTRYEPFNNSYGFNNTAVSGAGFRIGTDDLQWERTNNFNMGVDASFLQNRLTASFDYFHKLTSEILLTPSIPSAFGTILNKKNIGKMKNQGWELVLAYNMRTGEAQHSFSANVGDTYNEVTYFEGKEQFSEADRIRKIIREGLPVNSYYGYKVQGYFQNMQEIETAALPVGTSSSDLQPGDVRYIDRNNDGVIDSKDRFVLGHGFPRLTFGFTYDLKFKNFDFSMFWQGVGKRDMMVRGELVEPFHENYSFAIYQHQLDYWTPTNTDAAWPRLTAAGSASTSNNYQMESDIYLFNGRYARLKNLQVGYSLPQSWANRLHLQRARIFANAQNLLTLSMNSWIDPESSEFDNNMGGSANSARNYPTLKYYGLGLDIQF
ncbi:SusC/RagA family TonB-linked outer membrane protein [Sphingobacterium paludis]|uniref:TonB-linked SusC/RagA family outer membrane protein n=1 Tax=Sphingobacterium paludis TaxID=1476465 RepID=A0A4V3E1F8_9SPHI|nr:TonB-dependent receptor [Sphingobacterium paludis]TDS13198.1 TonB-linked SusC/RagA family outer membrane protein [Sphingobacterium paludis]